MDWRVATLRVVFLLTVATSLSAQQPPRGDTSPPAQRAQPAIGRRLTLAGVPNFGRVTPNLYRGGQPDAAGFAALAQRGINIVVDLRGHHHEREEVTRLGMQYVPIPWHCSHPKDEVFAEFLTVLRRNPGAKVFVHCFKGEDRTGMAIAAFRIADEGWTAEEAKHEMKAFGFASAHHLFCRGLATYEKRFPLIFRTRPAFENLRASQGSPSAP